MRRLKEVWHHLRPLLSRWLGEERLERILCAAGFYQWKSRLLVEKKAYPGGIVLWLREPDAGIVEGVLLRRSYDRAEVRAGDTVIDVGAHVGSYTVWASRRVGEKGRVISFEPEPENLRLLKKNLELNGCRNVRVFPVALSDVSGQAVLYVKEPPELHSMLRRSGAPLKVASLRLDDVARELALDRVGVLKIDAEGAELKILSAAPRILSLTREIVMELHKEWVSLGEMSRLLSLSGMRVEVLGEDAEVALLYARREGSP